MLNDSQLAVYEGMIALAWADHTLDANEKKELHDLINYNNRLSNEQREKLHNDVDTKIDINDVWHRITDKQDRAHLLNMAIDIFNQDGKFCDTEQDLYYNLRQRYLVTIDMDTLRKDFDALILERQQGKQKIENDNNEFRKKFSLFEAIKQKFLN